MHNEDIFWMYKHPMDLVKTLGVSKTLGNRIAVRAIVSQDLSALAEGLDTYRDTSQAICYEIIDIGDGVPDGKFRVGDHCKCVSGAVSFLSHDKGERVGLVESEWVLEVWNPSVYAEKLREYLDAKAEKANEMFS